MSIDFDLDQRIIVLESSLERHLSWAQSAEMRLAWGLPVSTAMLGAIAVLSPKAASWTVPMGITSSFAVTFLLLSILFFALSSFPRTSGPKGSLLYFGGISSKEESQYHNDMTNLTKQEYFEDLVSQCYRNAQVVQKKYSWLQRAFTCLFISSVPWVLSIYLLYSDAP